MKKNTLILLFAIWCFLFSQNLCATTINLSSGTDNGLENLIVASSTVSGDEIVLTDVGPYNCSTPKIVMTKSLTIRAAAGLSARPVVKVTATATQSSFMGFTTSGTYYLNWEGIEFDGNNYTTTFAQVYQPCKVKVKNCVFKNIRSTPTSTTSAVLFTYATTTNNDSLYVENTKMSSIYSNVLSITSSGAAHPSVATFNNCHFAGAFKSYALNVTTTTPVKLDHCTFDACSFPELKLAGTATISNCIFSNNTNADNQSSPVKMSLTSGNLTNHCAVYNPGHYNIYQNVDTTSALTTNPSLNSYLYATASSYISGGSDSKVIGFSPSLTVVVSPSTGTILQGGTHQYSATVTDKLSAFAPSVSWSTTSGSINSSGLYSGSTVGSSIPVTASAYGYSGSASVNVKSLTITVTPSTSSILVGETKQFTASAVDQNGQPYSTSFTWSASSGSNDANGLYTGSSAAMGVTITATAGAFSGTATIDVKALTITVTPASSSMVVGNTKQYSASAVDQNGQPYSGTFTWSASSGSIDQSGLYTATVGGVGKVITASLGGFSGNATLDVNSITITVTPGTASIIQGSTQQFTASAVDQNNNPYPGTFTWSTTSGSINSSGLHTGSTVGTGITVIASLEGQQGTATINVNSLTITVTPATPTIYKNTTQQFTATAVDQNNNPYTGPFTWSASSGTINSSGLYTGTTTGTGITVTASVNGFSGNASINVNELTITVSPSSSSIFKDGAKQFTATAVDQNNNAYTGTFTWSAAQGTINSSGLYTGTTAGTNIVVTASAEGFSGTANITVTALTITVTPANSSMNRGSSQQFSASAVDQDGQPYSTSFTWSASAGSITTGGLFICTIPNNNVVITASSNGFSGTANFKVNGLTTSLNAGASVSAAVTSLADGDTIVLAQTGTYTWTGRIGFTTPKSVSIRAAYGLATRPIIQQTTAVSGFIYYSAGTSPKTFYFEGVDFDGNNLAYGLMLSKCAASGNMKIIMKRCTVRNIYQSAGSLNAIAFTYGNVAGGPASYDDLIVEDTEFRSVQSAVIGTSALNSSPNNIRFKNCLFVGPFTKAAVGVGVVGLNSVSLDHCTFESFNLKELSLKTTTSGTTLKNCVFAHNSGSDVNSLGDGSLSSNCGVYYTGSGDANAIYPTLATSNALMNDPALNSYKYVTDSAYLARSTDGRGLGYSPKLKFVVSPSTFTMNKYGKKQFTFTVSDSLTAFVPTLKYSSSLGSITSSALFTGSTAGRDISITGSAYGQSKSAMVDVIGTNVFITPNPALVYNGYNKQFTSSAADQDGNSYSDTHSWATTGGLGSINTGGLFVPSAIGTGSVIATIGAFSDTIAFAVEPPSTIVNTTMGEYKFSWKFDKLLEHGSFVDGQPWIVLPSGGANLISVSPTKIVGASVKDLNGTTVSADIHQTVINPPVGSYYQNNTGGIKIRNAFGWDSRGAIRYGLGNNYSSLLPWDGNPKALSAGDVITTAWSLTTEIPNNTVLNAVAVLTVLDTIPPSDAFRPGVIRNSARRAHPEFIRKSDIVDLSSKLIAKPTTSLLGVTLPTDVPTAYQAAKLTKLYPGPSIMIAGNSNNRSFNALYNNSGNGYGREVAMDMGDLAVGALASWLTSEQRDSCRVRLIQRAIDTYETILDSAVLSYNGGHILGYGALITIGGKMLNHSGMLSFNQSINGRDPLYYLSDYAQVYYIDDSNTNYNDGIRPNVGNPKRKTTTSTLPSMNLKTVPILSATSGVITVDTAYHWPAYRAALEVPNLKLKIESGPGAGDQYYVCKGISDYYHIISGVDTLSNNHADDYIKGGTITVKPAWVNGTPTSASVIKTYTTVSTEAPCWAFKSSGIYTPTGLMDTDYSLSPITDYGSINAGSYLSYMCALYAVGGDSIYSSGMDKWMIETMTNPGYGDVLFRNGNGRQITDPNGAAGTPESPFLSGLWKNLVLDKVGVTYDAGNGTTDSLLIPPVTRSAKLNVEENLTDLSVYSSRGTVFVESPTQIDRIDLISLQGVVILSRFSKSYNTVLSLSHYPKGAYLLNVRTKGRSFIKKIILTD